MSESPPGNEAVPVTVLFVDISGSTFLYAVRGNEVAFTLTSACLRLLEEQVRLLNGRVVKRVGDAILASFEHAEHAVAAAAGMQSALQDTESAVRTEGLHVRVGIASGSAVLDEGDVYGDVVNVAARLVSLAGADEIFLAGETYDALPAAMQDSIRLIDQIELRGRPDWVVVYEYLWKLEGATISAGSPAVLGAVALEVTFGPQTFNLGPERRKLSIGRDADNDIAIPEQVVSRHHADIVLRGDKFLLVDRSTNGTYVQNDSGETFRLSRDEMTLAGGGCIFAGHRTLPPIAYRVGRR